MNKQIDINKALKVATKWSGTGVLEGIMKGSSIVMGDKIGRLDELKEFVIKDGEFQIKSYTDIIQFNEETIAAFCVQYGIYGFPTLELIDFLKNEIGDKKAIEIGSGRGILCKALGIIGTDNYQQREPEIAELYESFGQTTVKYGPHVERYDGFDSVKKYKPHTVVASWVTHKYNRSQHHRGGNAVGVREDRILERAKRYVFIGNDEVHKHKPMLDLPHQTYKFPWLLSRKVGQELNSIWIWEDTIDG